MQESHPIVIRVVQQQRHTEVLESLSGILSETETLNHIVDQQISNSQISSLSE